MTNEEREARLNELAVKIQKWDIKTGQTPQDWLDEYNNLWVEQIREDNEKKEKKSREMKNRRRRGKYAEKRTAMEVGGVRRGGVGMPDVEMEWCDLEVKERKKHIASITKDMIQARRLARKGKIPILQWIFRDTKEAFAIWDWKDFWDWHGEK